MVIRGEAYKSGLEKWSSQQMIGRVDPSGSCAVFAGQSLISTSVPCLGWFNSFMNPKVWKIKISGTWRETLGARGSLLQTSKRGGRHGVERLSSHKYKVFARSDLHPLYRFGLFAFSSLSFITTFLTFRTVFSFLRCQTCTDSRVQFG